TFPLPEAQMDRFLMRIRMGYPSKEEEQEIVLRFEKGTHVLPEIRPLNAEGIARLKTKAKEVYLSREIVDYLSEISRRTRSLKGIEMGVSPRATVALARACKSYALIRGRSYVIPDDVKDLAVPVLAHRLVVSQDMFYRGKTQDDLIREVLESVRVPVGDREEGTA
ncbi:MAG TPA: MoxR family ATPase, partial [Firmicutes bacterium]|nr:MoxR family ATPase [Candidatus Fermentithermobacillaceae bacterium]